MGIELSDGDASVAENCGGLLEAEFKAMIYEFVKHPERIAAKTKTKKQERVRQKNR